MPSSGQGREAGGRESPPRAICTTWLKDVYLMTRDPLADYVAAGADVITVHVESCTHVHRVRENVGRFPGVGVDIVVTGSAVFDGRGPAESARHMLRALGTG